MKISISEGIGKIVCIFFTFIVMHSVMKGGVWPIPVLRGLKIGGREGGVRTTFLALSLAFTRTI